MFDYATIDAAGRLRIYDGLDGKGNVLADVDLPITSPQTGPGTFVSDSVMFSGVGHSIIFDGGNKQLAFDDFALNPIVPEPTSLHVLTIGGLCGLCVILLARMRFAQTG
jgi:hypothetical protein